MGGILDEPLSIHEWETLRRCLNGQTIHPSGPGRLHFAMLVARGLVECPTGGSYRVTPKGRRLARKHEKEVAAARAAIGDAFTKRIR